MGHWIIVNKGAGRPIGTVIKFEQVLKVRYLERNDTYVLVLNDGSHVLIVKVTSYGTSRDDWFPPDVSTVNGIFTIPIERTKISFAHMKGVFEKEDPYWPPQVLQSLALKMSDINLPPKKLQLKVKMVEKKTKTKQKIEKEKKRKTKQKIYKKKQTSEQKLDMALDNFQRIRTLLNDKSITDIDAFFQLSKKLLRETQLKNSIDYKK